jgi:hypothetical protein
MELANTKWIGVMLWQQWYWLKRNSQALIPGYFPISIIIKFSLYTLYATKSYWFHIKIKNSCYLSRSYYVAFYHYKIKYNRLYY